MDDTCVIDRAAAGEVLDQVTGKIVVARAGRVYDGRSKIKPNELQPRDSERGGDYKVRDLYAVGIPATSPVILPGDVVTWTSSRRDQELVDNRYVVIKPVETTMLVQRKLVVERLS